MYFGASTNNFQPNEYARDNRAAHYDHLWPGREGSSGSTQRKKQQMYADELKKQIEEQNKRRRALKEDEMKMESYFVSGRGGGANYGSNFAKNNAYNSSNISNALNYNEPITRSNNNNNNSNNSNSYISNNNNNNNSYISKQNMPSASDFSFSTSMTSMLQAPVAKTSNFAETLRAQIDEARQGSYSGLAYPIKSLSSTQQVPTFSTVGTFESSPLDLPSAPPARTRNSFDRKNIKLVSMNGAMSMRSSLDQTHVNEPVISMESPFDRSIVQTPASGFSCKLLNNLSNRTSYLSALNTSKSSLGSSNFESVNQGFKPSYMELSGTQSSLPSLNSQSTNDQYQNQAASFEVDSRMIYPDGHTSPV